MTDPRGDADDAADAARRAAEDARRGPDLRTDAQRREDAPKEAEWAATSAEIADLGAKLDELEAANKAILPRFRLYTGFIALGVVLVVVVATVGVIVGQQVGPSVHRSEVASFCRDSAGTVIGGANPLDDLDDAALAAYPVAHAARLRGWQNQFATLDQTAIGQGDAQEWISDARTGLSTLNHEGPARAGDAEAIGAVRDAIGRGIRWRARHCDAG